MHCGLVGWFTSDLWPLNICLGLEFWKFAYFSMRVKQNPGLNKVSQLLALNGLNPNSTSNPTCATSDLVDDVSTCTSARLTFVICSQTSDITLGACSCFSQGKFNYGIITHVTLHFINSLCDWWVMSASVLLFVLVLLSFQLHAGW